MLFCTGNRRRHEVRADTASANKKGDRIILVGLVLQIIIFAFFLLAAVLLVCSQWYVGAIQCKKDEIDLEATNSSLVRSY